MTRLFGFICNQPRKLPTALEPLRDHLRATGPVARWGLGYVQSGEVLLSRNPRVHETGVDFYQALQSVNSDYVIGRACDADGLKGNANTPPFRFRGWFFAMGSGTTNLQGRADAIAAHIPGFLRRNIRGKTSAELVFHLFLAMLHDAGKLDDPDLDPAVTRRALRDSIAMIGGLSPEGETAEFGNVIVSNSRSMVAARLMGPLFMRQIRLKFDERRPESEFKGVVVVDGSSIPGEGFEEIPANSALVVHRDLRSDIASLSA